MIKSAYIHIPFCEKICSYCDFCKVLYDKKFVNKYLEELEKEITTTYQQEELETIYIGGGTPTCLEEEELERLLRILSKLKRKENVEYTIEGNFSSITNNNLDLLKKYQINRLSIGVESIHKKNQVFLNRELNKEEIEEKLKWMRERGFSNINLDLMYALPNESIKELEEDLEYLLSLKVEHISTYSLMIEENTLLGIQKVKSISEDLDSKMYETIMKRLKENHFLHYEISNFAKPGYESKHNMCYWKNEEYYGFGLSASSYQKGKRITNTKSITNYIKGINHQEIEEVTEEDKIEYEILLNLRMTKGINLIEFKKKYKKELKDIYQYDNLIQNNCLIEEKNHLYIPEDKLYISNEIIVKILQNKRLL